MFERRKDPKPEAVKPADQQATAQPIQQPTARKTAMIGASIKIKGDVVGDENLVIEGEVDGQVTLNNHELTIGESGKVTADLRAKTIRIDGSVTGDIDGQELVIVSKSGRVLGNIVAPRVTLEDGAQFKGSIDMSPSKGTAPQTSSFKPEVSKDTSEAAA